MADDSAARHLENGGIRVAPPKSTLLVDFNEKVVMVKLNWAVGLLLAIGFIGFEKVVENFSKQDFSISFWWTFPFFIVAALVLETICVRHKEKKLRGSSIPFEEFYKIRTQAYANSTGTHVAGSSAQAGGSGIGR